MLGPLALHLMTLQVFSVMRDPTLASVPFFLFMGFLLEQSGLMERLFRGIQLAFASVRGSLYLAVLVTATIFAAATGIVGSSVTLLGVMAAPAMKRSRLRRPHVGRRDHRRRHARHPDSAVGDADRDGAGGRRPGDRPLRRRGDTGPDARAPLHRLHARSQLSEPAAGSGAAARRSGPNRSATWCGSSCSASRRSSSSSSPRWA